MSSTTLQVMMQMEEFRPKLDKWIREFHDIYVMPLTDLFIKRIYLQRPHTDDMMQMCMDLGVDVPDFQPVSFDGLTFRWR